jgi:hypothetical protein
LVHLSVNWKASQEYIGYSKCISVEFILNF